MLSRRLFDILKNGTLVDNQSYLIREGILNNRRIDPVQLLFREGSQHRRVWNNEYEIWNFLYSVSRDIEKELKKENSEALVLFNDKDYEHNTEGGFITISGTNAKNFVLNTGNIIGFVKHGDYALKISSRFGDAFLKYIIADADGFLEIENFGGESHGGSFRWLLAYLWNIKFKRAYRLGLPKKYVSKTDRTSRVRGKIDVVDYFQNTTSDKYLCSYREHSYNNLATSLFVRAYESIKCYSFTEGTRNIYNKFLTANQGEIISRQQIFGSPRSLRFTNPFYNDYNGLIDLSKRILSQSGSDFSLQQESSSFLFDVSMLFEYFIRKLIKRNGFILFDKLEKRREIPTGVSGSYKRKLEPDIVFECKDSLYIFDVKYKNFDFITGVKREDLFQLHTYIGQYGNNDSPIKGCGFIYPISTDDWERKNPENLSGLVSDEICQQKKRIPFHVIFLKIPDNKSPDFAKLMIRNCHSFMQQFYSLVSTN